ncbi:MAG TPA: AI-2E family transporter [Candidatus Acidoferrales bacterium]|nr:AI-2E family transporter [Candidatus Acidoferrales bacterium]
MSVPPNISTRDALEPAARTARPSILGFDRTAARYTWTVALVLLLLALIYEVRITLFVFILAVLFAYLLSPAVDLLDRAFPNRTRTLALAIVYVAFVGIVVIAVTQIGTRVADEARTLAGKFPAVMASWQQSSGHPPVTLQERVVAGLRSGIMQKTNEIIAALPNAGLKIISVVSNVVYLVVVPILAFFFLKDGAQIRDQILDLVQGGPLANGLAGDLLADIHHLLARYIRALVVLSLSTFTCYITFFTIIGMPYGILLAAMAMMLEFIPMIGPLVAGTIVMIVALMSGTFALGVLVFLLAFRMFQDYVISPHIMGQGVELHPLLILFGVFAGAEVAGIPGSFLSVPILALIRVFYVRLRRQRLRQ